MAIEKATQRCAVLCIAFKMTDKGASPHWIFKLFEFRRTEPMMLSSWGGGSKRRPEMEKETILRILFESDCVSVAGKVLFFEYDTD